MQQIATDLDGEATGLAAVMERTRRSFEERGGVLRGGDATAGVSVTADAIEVVPYQWESAVR